MSEATREQGAAERDDPPFGAAALERGLLVLALLAPLAHSTLAVDPVRLPELTAVLVVAAGLLGTRLAVAAAERRVPLPRDLGRPAALAAVAAGAFALLALVAALVTADVPWRALLGGYGRADGALLLTAGAVVLLVALDRLDAPAVRLLARAAVAVAAVVGAHAVMQLLGADPLGWRLPVEAGTSTLGSPARVAVVLASAAPLVVAAAAQAGGRRRLALLALAAALLAVAAVVSPAEALVAALAAVVVAAAALLVGAGSGWGRAAWGAGSGWGRAAWGAGSGWARAALAAGGAALAGLVAAVAGIAGVGPLRALADQAEGAAAGWGWQAALAMAADAPLVGVGLGGFAGHAGASRSAEAAAATGAPAAELEPGGVPAQLLAEGGLPLLAAWVVLQVAVALALVAGLRRHTDARRRHLTALGAGWAAWLAVSLVVSVGPAVWVWGLVLAAGLVALARAPADEDARAPAPPAPRPVAAVAGVVAVALAVTAVLPLRADRMVGDAQEYAADGQLLEARITLVDATDANPLEARYWRERGSLAVAVGDGDAALAAYDEASRRDPRDPMAPREAARVAEQLEAPAVADARWRLALSLDPRHPPLLDEAAAHWVAQGEGAQAEEVLRRALAIDDRAERWVRLGQARLVQDDVAGAEDAFAQALERDPGVADDIDLDALP